MGHWVAKVALGCHFTFRTEHWSSGLHLTSGGVSQTEGGGWRGGSLGRGHTPESPSGLNSGHSGQEGGASTAASEAQPWPFSRSKSRLTGVPGEPGRARNALCPFSSAELCLARQGHLHRLCSTLWTWRGAADPAGAVRQRPGPQRPSWLLSHRYSDLSSGHPLRAGLHVCTGQVTHTALTGQGVGSDSGTPGAVLPLMGALLEDAGTV